MPGTFIPRFIFEFRKGKVTLISFCIFMAILFMIGILIVLIIYKMDPSSIDYIFVNPAK